MSRLRSFGDAIGAVIGWSVAVVLAIVMVVRAFAGRPRPETVSMVPAQPARPEAAVPPPAPGGDTEERQREPAWGYPAPPSPSRREFLRVVGVALGGAGAVIVGVPFVGFLLSPLLKTEGAVWRAVGPVDSFTVGATTEVTFTDASPLPWAGVEAQSAAWLRRSGQNDFTAFAINCTHLGCPVQWLDTADLFMCPCHGGVFNKDGTVAGGPPPRPLVQYQVRITDGQVEIQTGPLPIT